MPDVSALFVKGIRRTKKSERILHGFGRANEASMPTAIITPRIGVRNS
jgi:hypothetical protein